MKFFSRIFFMALLLFSFAFFPTNNNASAATVYVNSSTGNDISGDGLSGSPYKTFHKGYTMTSASDILDLTGTFTWTDADETGDVITMGYTIGKNLIIQGQSADTTIIQAASSYGTGDRAVFNISAGYVVTINDLTVRYGYNRTGSNGGGINNEGTLTVNRSSISQNYVWHYPSWGGYGGGIRNAGTLTVNDSTINNNFAQSQGGGVVNAYTASGTNISYITNSTIAFNSTAAVVATVGGAGIFLRSGTAYVTNTTIAYNVAPDGTGDTTGIDVDSAILYIKNSIVAGNKVTVGGTDYNVNYASGNFFDISNSGTVYDNGGNVFGKVDTAYTGVSFSATTWYDLHGNGAGDNIFTLYNTATTGSLYLDASLAENNTLYGTQTLALSTGSVAINTGASGTNGVVSVPTTDQRGLSRAGATDIGAYEFGAISNSVPILGHIASNVLGTGTQVADGTGSVNIPFRIQDADSDGCVTLGWQYSDDSGSSWNSLIVGDMTGEDGSKTSAVNWIGTEHTIVWNSKNQINNTSQNDIQFRFIVNDGTINSAYGTSGNFSVDNINPTVSTLSPVDGATGIAVDANLIITFDEIVDRETGNIVIKKTSDNSTIETIVVTSGQVTGTGTTTITIDPTSDFIGETSYYIQIDATAFDDVLGNSYAGIANTTTWNFATGDVSSPTISATSPSGEQTAGTTSVTMLLSTNESATCKYSGTSGVAFASMTAFTTTGGTSHSAIVSGLSDGNSYSYYAKCQDSSSNESTESAIYFSVANSSGSASVSLPGAVGRGQVDANINMGQSKNIGAVSSNGVNVLGYINSRAKFSTAVSNYNNWIAQDHTFEIISFDLFTNIITIRVSSELKIVILSLNEVAKVDLDDDSVFDIEIKFEDIYINRAELTIISLFESWEEEDDDMSNMSYENNLIKYSNSPKIYLVESNLKRWIVSESAFIYHKYEWNSVLNVGNEIIFADGDDVTKNITKTEACIFIRDLKINMTGEDVKELQKYLNSNGFIVSEVGYGSIGNETEYFGPATHKALVCFQQAKNLPTYGFFGPMTRALVN